MSGFLVSQPGMLTLIQDSGRYGYHNVGLTTSGPMDKESAFWANRLVENNGNAILLEVTVGGLELQAQENSQIAVTGAQMALTINDKERPLWRSHNLTTGDVVKLGFAEKGMRCYLAVRGGFKVKSDFGSASVTMREGVGGIESGQKLAAGDVLDLHQACNTLAQCWSLAKGHRPEFKNSIELRAIPAYQHKHFSKQATKQFFTGTFEISKNCDRMGYRLTGPNVAADINGILSEGICLGAVQVPADGQPIILLNDRQTIGGYPKIASVLSVDLAKLAQAGQGTTVRFVPTTIENAHNQLHLQHYRLNAIQLDKC